MVLTTVDSVFRGAVRGPRLYSWASPLFSRGRVRIHPITSLVLVWRLFFDRESEVYLKILTGEPNSSLYGKKIKYVPMSTYRVGRCDMN